MRMVMAKATMFWHFGIVCLYIAVAYPSLCCWKGDQHKEPMIDTKIIWIDNDLAGLQKKLKRLQRMLKLLPRLNNIMQLTFQGG